MTERLFRFLNLLKEYKFRTPIFIFVELKKKIKFGSLYRKLYLKIFTFSKIGNNITIESNFRISPFTKISIGNNFYLGHNAVVESKLSNHISLGIVIGNNVWISRDIHIQNSDLILISDNVLIGEFVSIRTNKHSTNINKPIKSQNMIVGKILIEKNVWIGRGVIIEGNSEGLTIGENSIIGANSYLKKSVPKNSIFGGNPAKFIKKRKE